MCLIIRNIILLACNLELVTDARNWHYLWYKKYSSEKIVKYAGNLKSDVWVTISELFCLVKNESSDF